VEEGGPDAPAARARRGEIQEAAAAVPRGLSPNPSNRGPSRRARAGHRHKHPFVGARAFFPPPCAPAGAP
jgi:hypothetical protein